MINHFAAAAIFSTLLFVGAACEQPTLPDKNPAETPQETVPTQDQQIKTELFFGRSIPEGGVVTDSMWESFRENVLKDYFSGYTEVDAEGYWTNGAGASESEQSKVVIYLHNDTRDEYAKIDSVILIYKSEYEQESVLQIHTDVEAEF